MERKVLLIGGAGSLPFDVRSDNGYLLRFAEKRLAGFSIDAISPGGRTIAEKEKVSMFRFSEIIDPLAPGCRIRVKARAFGGFIAEFSGYPFQEMYPLAQKALMELAEGGAQERLRAIGIVSNALSHGVYYDNRKAIEELVDSLNDRDIGLKMSAANALADIREDGLDISTALDGLRAAGRHENMFIRNNALRAISFHHIAMGEQEKAMELASAVDASTGGIIRHYCRHPELLRREPGLPYR